MSFTVFEIIPLQEKKNTIFFLSLVLALKVVSHYYFAWRAAKRTPKLAGDGRKKERKQLWPLREANPHSWYIILLLLKCIKSLFCPASLF